MLPPKRLYWRISRRNSMQSRFDVNGLHSTNVNTKNVVATIVLNEYERMLTPDRNQHVRNQYVCRTLSDFQIQFCWK